jgi:hypothetical protein
MRRFHLATAVALLALSVTACKKNEPAPAPPAATPEAAPAADATAAAPAPSTPGPVPMPAAPSPAAVDKNLGQSALTDACPMPGEDAAACPKKPDKVDDNIQVGHVLIGWDGSLPGKKVGRTKEEAFKLATQLAHDARKPGADFVKLIWAHSDDPGPGVYKVTPDLRGRYVPPFSAMATALGEGQVDVVETKFGYHVMKRLPFAFVPPEKPLEKVATDPCPQAGEDQATCPTAQTPAPTTATVSHILIGYQGSLPGENVTRTKDEAKALAIKLLHDARKKGADFAKLMKDNSQDPGPGTYPVSPDAHLVPPFKQLSLTLGKGQIDIVETSFGFHIIKRTE